MAAKTAEMLLMVGLPEWDSIRWRLLAGLSISSASASNPTVALLAAPTKQSNDLQSVFGQIDAQPRTTVDLVRTNASEPFHIGKIALLYSAYSHSNVGSSDSLQGFEPVSKWTVAIGKEQFFYLETHIYR